jgi:3-phosphoshikimate 1-carboxyvinyltransferase
MVSNLNALGAKIEELPDGCLIRGVRELQAGRVRSFGDHRTAMSLAIAALAARGQVVLEDTDCIATSFPAFFEIYRKLFV